MNTKTLENTLEDNLSYRDGRFSGFIRPVLYLIDLAVVIYGASLFFQSDFDLFTYGIFISICWVVISIQFGFYQIHRNSRLIGIVSKIVKQTFFFSLMVFAFFGYYYQLDKEPAAIGYYILASMATISIIKVATFYLFKSYREKLGGNFRKIVILGQNHSTNQLADFFKSHPDYGYRTEKIMNINSSSFNLEEFKEWVLENQVDEIFCSVKEFTNEQLLELTDFADNNLRTLKFVPDSKEILSRKLEYDYYGLTPVLSLRTIPLDHPVNKIAKRLFDILFSLLVIVGILSWLTPLMAILIKLESKGPVFFKQKRNGLSYEEFECYKFRSMTPNKNAHLHQVSRGDQRITGVGKFLRKTSIDELPQFFNVFLGNMSVVGPRPHMVSHTHMYADRVDKFMVRHFVKPGITGLAQVSGYRGEVESDDDIIGRVKNDIYYIENWSVIMDLRIILQTVLNVIRGEDKAY